MLNLSALRFHRDRTPLAWTDVALGVRVGRGPHWRPRWKDDVCRNDGAVGIAHPRGTGVVIGYIGEDSVLVGRNTDRVFEHDRLGATPRWAAVRWDSGLESVYAVGWRGITCLSPA